MPRAIRRVVTGHNADGRSTFVDDLVMDTGRANVFSPSANPTTRLVDLWKMSQVPGVFDGNIDPAAGPVKLEPQTDGLVFRTVEIPPDSERDFAAMGDYFSEMGAGGKLDTGNPRHGAMHTTETVDLVVILSGEVFLMLEDGERHLQPGDVVIQRGTAHAWSNRTNDPCIFAVVLIGARGDRHNDHYPQQKAELAE